MDVAFHGQLLLMMLVRWCMSHRDEAIQHPLFFLKSNQIKNPSAWKAYYPEEGVSISRGHEFFHGKGQLWNWFQLDRINQTIPANSYVLLILINPGKQTYNHQGMLIDDDDMMVYAAQFPGHMTFSQVKNSCKNDLPLLGSSASVFEDQKVTTNCKKFFFGVATCVGITTDIQFPDEHPTRI